MNKKMKRLKDYSIKTKIIIEEHREKYTDGKGLYEQPVKCFSFTIDNGHGRHIAGGFQTKKKLLKRLSEELL